MGFQGIEVTEMKRAGLLPKYEKFICVPCHLGFSDTSLFHSHLIKVHGMKATILDAVERLREENHEV